METDKFTPRNVGKFAAKHLVGAIVGKAIKEIVLELVPAAEHLKTAELVGAVTGWYASSKLEPYTDDIVDFAVDEIQEYRVKRHIAKHIA